MSEEIKQNAREVFSKNKQAYVDSSTHKKQSDLDEIINWMQPTLSQKALDIATGGGHVAKALSGYVKTIFATDLTKDMLQNTSTHLTDKTNIEYVIADAENLPFIDESFDIVTCRIAPHHFPSPKMFIKEVSRVLKQNGKFLMIDNIAPEEDQLDHFYNTFEKKRDNSHVRALKKKEWDSLFPPYDLLIQKQLLRKKQMPFPDWVKRTIDNPKEQEEVESLFLQASPDEKHHFSIIVEDGRVQSFTIDEYMVLVEKHST